MFLTDVNVLVYAFRKDSHPDHPRYHAWVEDMVNGGEVYGVSDLVLSGFVRVVTHPNVFEHPSTLDHALEFVAALRSQENARRVAPGPDHWRIFTDLCQQSDARGNLIPDAYLAALAIESDSEWITTDRHFRRFAGLRWHHPLD